MQESRSLLSISPQHNDTEIKGIKKSSIIVGLKKVLPILLISALACQFVAGQLVKPVRSQESSKCLMGYTQSEDVPIAKTTKGKITIATGRPISNTAHRTDGPNVLEKTDIVMASGSGVKYPSLALVEILPPTAEIMPITYSILGTPSADKYLLSNKNTSTLIVEDASATAGSDCVVSVLLDAQGNEGTFGFSLSFDTDRITYVSATLGNDIPENSYLAVNDRYSDEGMVGFAVFLDIFADPPASMPSQINEILRVRFTVADVPCVTTPIAITNTPVLISISDIYANNIETSIVDGEVSITNPEGESPGEGEYCDDGDACTIDSYTPASGCIHTPIDCDDNDACTEDICDPDVGCIYTVANCNDGNKCTADACNPDSGCVYTPIDCDDGDACTEDTCDPDFGCVYTPIVCDDNDACTEDTCYSASGCVYTPILCDDGDACTEDACDPASGCVYTPILCNDDDACTEDACDPDLGCVYTPILCNDGDACTEDACNPDSGCVYTPIDCDDDDECTEDSCDPETGACIHTPIPGCGDLLHPADLDGDWRLTMNEAIIYLMGWQKGENLLGHAIRGIYLWQNGEYYMYDDSLTEPMCWVLIP